MKKIMMFLILGLLGAVTVSRLYSKNVNGTTEVVVYEVSIGQDGTALARCRSTVAGSEFRRLFTVSFKNSNTQNVLDDALTAAQAAE